MTGTPLAASYDAMGRLAYELRRCSVRVAGLTPVLVAELAVVHAALAPVLGLAGDVLAIPGEVLGLATLVRCLAPGGLPLAAAELAALAAAVRAAALAYAEADRVAEHAGPPGWLLLATDPGLALAGRLAAPAGAFALLVAWDAEHRLVPAALRPRLADPLLDAFDVALEGEPVVSDITAGTTDPSPGALGAAARSPGGALGVVRALSRSAPPSTFSVVQTAAGPPPRYVVCLPGLRDWSGADTSTADLPGAVVTLTGHSGYITGVRRTVERLGRGSRVLLVGHSQGGMVAEAIAADPAVGRSGVTVSAVLTAGSPRLADNPVAGVRYLALENDHDPVPPLRTLAAGVVLPAIPQPRSPDTDVVRFPADRGRLTMANHALDAGGYLRMAASDEPRVAAFRTATRAFFTGSAVSVRVYQVTDDGHGALPIPRAP